MQQRAVQTTRSADGTTLAFERTGSGPTLLLVDPAGSFRGNSPLATLARLLTAHFTVVTYDRRGRGESGDTPPYAVEREVEDLAAILREVGPSFVFGFSSGAVLALRAAAAGLPIRKLVLFEAPIGDGAANTTSRSLTDELERLTAAGQNAEALELFQSSIGVPREMIETMRGSPMYLATVPIARTLVYDCRIANSTGLDHARRVRLPTLVMESADTTGPMPGWVAELVRTLPDAQHRRLPGQWHWAREEDQVPVLRQFLLGEA